MIAFEQQRVASCQMRQDVRCGMAQISQYPQLCRTIGACELQGLSGIVRDGKWRYLQGAQINSLAVTRDMQQAIKIRRSDSIMRPPAHPDGNAVAQRQCQSASDVVGMLMGYKNCTHIGCRQARQAQAMLQVFEPQPAVN